MILNSKNLPYDGTDHFNGIIKYFRDETKDKDPANYGLITLSSSCTSDAHNIFVDESDGTKGYWACAGIGSWIQLGFKRNRVALTAYTIYCYGWDFLREWKVLASDDNKTWRTISHKTLSKQPEGSELFSLVFNTDYILSRKYIRFVSLSNRFQGDTAFPLHRIELFGMFFSSKDINNKTCTFRTQNKCFVLILFIIVS